VLFRGHEFPPPTPTRSRVSAFGIKTQVPNVFDGLSVREKYLAGGKPHPCRRACQRVVDEMLERIGPHRRRQSVWSASSHMVSGNVLS